MSFLRLAHVVATHPEDNSVDVVLVDDGSRYAGVQCLAAHAAGNSGVSNMPDVTPAGSGKWDATAAGPDRMIAVVGFLHQTAPVVVGFLFPQANSMLFADRNRKVERHVSDVYTSTDGAGNFELSHPSGTYLRIGTDPAHEDLTGKDFDAAWKITKNTGKRVFVHLSVRNGGAEVARLSLTPDGDLEAQCDRDATVTVGRNLTATVAGNASATVAGNLTSSAASWAHTGPVTITGDVTVHGSVAADGGGFTHNGTNVGSTHKHSGVSSGLSNTGNPV